MLREKATSIQQVIWELKKDTTTYGHSDGGITLSGGRSLVQCEFASELLQVCKGQGWRTVIETTGVGNRGAIEKVTPCVDATFPDLKRMDNKKHKRFTGIGNEPVIKNAPETCRISKATIRVPMISGFNYSVEAIKAIPEFARTLAGIRTIYLLPYYPSGESKYGLLGQDYTMRQVKPLAPEDLEECRTVVENYGFQCITGGQIRFQNGGRGMDQQLIERVMKQVSDEPGIKQEECRAGATKEECCSSNIGLTGFVGTAIGGTIGLVIASVDPLLVDVMKLGKYRFIGIIGGRIGTGPQIWAVDKVVRVTNIEIISVKLLEDTKDGAGHGSLIYIGVDDMSDARRAVEIALQVLPKYFGDVYRNGAGHLEFQYTARANYCLEKALGVPVGRAFGMTRIGPAAIGTALTDIAVKAANMEVIGYCSPPSGASCSNEVILTFTGNPGTVRQTVEASIGTGKKVLGVLGGEPESTATPYIQ